MRVVKRITEQTIQSCVSEHVQNVIERMGRNMKRKFLEDLGLEKDVVDSIMAENGKDIEAAKVDAKALEAKVSTLESENSGLKSQVSDRDKQLEKLKASGGDAEALKAEITKLQETNKAQENAHKAEIRQLKVNAAVDAALTAAKAKNLTAVKALLKDMDKAELAEDGTVKGLAEQIKALQGAENSKFMFDSPVEKKPAIRGVKIGESGNDDNDPPADLSKMSYEQLAAYMDANPDVQF